MSVKLTSPIDLLIADDHELFVQGIVQLFDDIDNVRVCGVAHTSNTLNTLLQKREADVLLLDLNLGNADGMELLANYTQTHPNLKIIVLTMHSGIDKINEALQLGAQGYLIKNTCVDELCEAIYEVAEGGQYLSEWAAEKLAGKEAVDNGHATIQLTSREQEVLILICEGYTNTEIADKLFIEASTVKTHRKSLLVKLDTKGTAGLVKQAIKHKLYHF